MFVKTGIDLTKKCQIKNKLMYYHLKIRHCASYNHCQSTATQCIVIAINDATGKSSQQRLITKEHIATHTNLIVFGFILQYFKSSIKLFYAEILTVTYITL